MSVSLVKEHAQNRSGVQSILRRRVISRATGKELDLLDMYDAQIGEIGWHSTHVDDTLDAVSAEHAARIIQLARAENLVNPRILELGAYAHYSAQIAADALGGTAVSHDISAASVAVGSRMARDAGLKVDHYAVAGDFHSLPFEDNAFDITFIASAVHHTWRPWQVLSEMVRVTRPGGIIHLENEPVGRMACLYHFRGNRPEEFTLFEKAIDDAGLTHMLVSPFPGSRAEKLFGIVENDRIPLHIYEDTLLQVGTPLEWQLDTGSVIGEFERWLLTERPAAPAIAHRLLSGISDCRKSYLDVDSACGFSLPEEEAVWPMAYRIEAALAEVVETNVSSMARLFGAALRATIRKSGNGTRSQKLFRKTLREASGVYVDDVEAHANGMQFANVLPDPELDNFGPDWHALQEAGGFYTLANAGPDCIIEIDQPEGFLILRAYSVVADKLYFLSVLRNSDLVYSHGVGRSESHLAKIFFKPGDVISIHHHDADGQPVNLPYHTRLIPRFVPTS